MRLQITGNTASQVGMPFRAPLMRFDVSSIYIHRNRLRNLSVSLPITSIMARIGQPRHELLPPFRFVRRSIERVPQRLDDGVFAINCRRAVDQVESESSHD